MASRASGIHLQLQCPLCDLSLQPVPIGDTLPFHCGNGHKFSVTEMVTALSGDQDGGLEILLGEWKCQHRALTDIIEEARAKGYLNIAEVFLRNASRLASRIEILQGALEKRDSSNRIRLPESLNPS